MFRLCIHFRVMLSVYVNYLDEKLETNVSN